MFMPGINNIYLKFYALISVIGYD